MVESRKKVGTTGGGKPAATRAGLPRRLASIALPQDAIPAIAARRSTPERQARAYGLARACAQIAEDNRARDVVVLDLRKSTPLVDFFVLATAVSRRQASAIGIEIDANMKREGEHKLGMEGSEEGRWILIDYGDFVVHVFSEDARPYYGLEELWGDAAAVDWKQQAQPDVLTEAQPAPAAELPAEPAPEPPGA